MVKAFPIQAESPGSIGHHALALSRSDGRAKVRFARQTELALAALGGIKRYHMISWRKGRYAFANFDNDPTPFVAKHTRE